MRERLRTHHYFSDIVGWLELCTSSRGVRSINFVAPPSEAKVCHGDPMMNKLVAELDDYFAGKLRKFSVPLDPASGTDFRNRVWKQLRAIPYGQTRAYSQIAAAIGDPKAARAVGSANGCNPIPIIIPCHRVVKADATIGGFSSGIYIKKKLLALEGVSL
jgi:methylated-DNA-[protein]-cysteine S-methyltransferase